MTDSLSPCMDCTSRHPACHAACKLYAEWVAARRKRKAEIDAHRLPELAADKYAKDRAMKMRNYYHKPKRKRGSRK